MGMRRSIDGAHGGHGHSLLQAADDDFPSRVSADARSRSADRGSRRTFRTKCAPARRLSRRSSGTSTALSYAQCCGRHGHENPAGGEPPRVSRLCHRAGRQPGALRVVDTLNMDGLVAVGAAVGARHSSDERRGDTDAGSSRARLPVGGARRLHRGIGDDGRGRRVSHRVRVLRSMARSSATRRPKPCSGTR